jgi:COP9 signalosome complex subunit 2
MSDFGNDDFMHDDDGEDEYDFEYSDAGEDEPDVDLENKYYSAKGMKDDDPAASISEFQSVLDTEDDKSEWYRFYGMFRN